MAEKLVYGPDIHEAVARGDLEEMRNLVREAEAHVARYGNVPVALELLKTEIAKLEARGAS
jgi:hypothetical protein